jgi:myo-inositol-1(or 4)-monophosphatase
MPDPIQPNSARHDGVALLYGMVTIATAAGRRLLAAFSPEARPHSRDAMLAAVRRNEEIACDGLRDGLAALRPGAAWLDSERESEQLPDGEWWVVDPVEGNVNHVHGLRDWGVTITLVRDREPVATVVHQPLDSLTWTAFRGGGARLNGQLIHASQKSHLDAAIATTGQAEAGQFETHRAIGHSVAAMLDRVLLVRMAVPSTFPMLRLACGQDDVFWQYAPVLPGIAAGLLMVTEAGGIASRIDGTPWQPGAPDIVLAAPGLHGAAVDVLRACHLREHA